MFQQRKKPPVGPAKTEGEQAGQELARPKRPSIDEAVGAIDDAGQENDMSELFTEAFGEEKSSCGCF